MNERNKQLEYLDRLKAHTGKSLSAIARDSKKDPATLTRFVNSDSKFLLSTTTIVALEKSTGLLFEGGESLPLSQNETVDVSKRIIPLAEHIEIPLYDATASAGGGAWNSNAEVIDMIPVEKAYLRKLSQGSPEDCFFIQVRGDSMYNPSRSNTIQDGDKVLVDRSQFIPTEGRIYAIETPNGLIIKRLQYRGASIFAISDSGTLDAIALDNDSKVIGRVISKFSITEM